MASDGVTLDVVRTTVGEIPGAESSVDIAYDENGDRVWYSYSGTGQDRGFTEITVPGVGVYRADRVDGADGEFRLVRMDLVAGGYRDAGGSVHFPVKDAQGNVRGYASSAGLESAYDYYPYGTAVELSANGADDRRRWQGKEFDGEHGKYYFGARYFDPFFALWASPDPAGQFANPYSYGGDPVNYVDPSGEIVIAAILAGAAVGAPVQRARAGRLLRVLRGDQRRRRRRRRRGGRVGGGSRLCFRHRRVNCRKHRPRITFGLLGRICWWSHRGRFFRCSRGIRKLFHEGSYGSDRWLGLEGASQVDACRHGHGRSHWRAL